MTGRNSAVDKVGDDLRTRAGTIPTEARYSWPQGSPTLLDRMRNTAGRRAVLKPSTLSAREARKVKRYCAQEVETVMRSFAHAAVALLLLGLAACTSVRS